jgi:hypothetical protein
MLAGIVASMVSLLVDKHSLYDRLKVRYLREIERENLSQMSNDSSV